MQNREESTKSVYSNPGYFGAYLNMAVLNVFAISNQIVEKFKELDGTVLERDSDSDIKRSNKNLLLQIFDNPNRSSEKKMSVLNFLVKRQYFPVLKYFLACYEDEENNNFDETKLFESTQLFLKESFKALVDLRNDFTHFAAVDQNGQEVKKKYKINENLADLLQNELILTSVDFSKTRFSETHIESDFEFVKHVQLVEHNLPKLTEQGLYFFINLFLEKGKAYLFLKKLTGFKNETTPPFKATLKVFSAFCLKLPKEKIENSNYKQSLLMEMLPELAKCPAILYNKLSEEDKQKFQPALSNEAKQNIQLNSINYEKIDIQKLEKEIGNLVSQKRRSDRFHYFALRFLDELDVFKKIKFQIKLGKLRFSENDIRQKEILGEMQARKITKAVCAYGKLSDVESKTGNEIIKALEGHTSEWEFDQFAPHYNMQNNKIAFRIAEQINYPTLKTDDKNINQPDGHLSLHILPKLVLTAIFKPEKVETLIENFIDKNNNSILNLEVINEIKAKLDFPKKVTRRLTDYSKKLRILSESEKRENPNSAKFIENETLDRKDYALKMEDRNEQLNKVLKAYNLHHSQLPGVIKDYLLNIKSPSLARRINTFLKAEKSTFEQSLKKIEQQKELKHKIKLGELATIITRDIVNMLVSKQLKQKLTPPYINKIQNAIANFGLKKNDLINMLTEWKVLDQSVGHCFLHKNDIQVCTGVIQFYETYAGKKIEYIDKIKKKTKTEFGIKPNSTVSNKLPYKYRRLVDKYKKADIEDYLNKKRKAPVNVPLNLFNEVLFKELEVTTRDGETGLNNLLAAYLEDDTQVFYQYERVYNINKKTTKINVNDKFLGDIKEEFGKPVFENEKKIRYQQMIDRVMKLMCIDLIQKQESDLELDISKLKLSNLNADTPDKNFLNTPVSFKRDVASNKILIAEDNKATREEVQQSIQAYKAGNKNVIEHWYSWTVKDYGRFSRVVLDRRLPNLLKHFEHESIPIAVIMYELKSYDEHWHKILDKLLKLEEAILKKDKARIIYLHTGSRFNHIQFDKYVKWMEEKGINFNKNLIKNVRNKFSHSEFVEVNKVGLDKITNEDTGQFNENYKKAGWIKNNYKSIAEQVYEKYEQEIDNILNQIAAL